jgi:glycosyltransferase involved in cell wall biosynthesis
LTVLQIIVDEMISAAPNGKARYTEELISALIKYAPRGCVVEGIVSASPESDYDRIADRLPGLSGLSKSALTRGQLTTAWQHGFTRVAPGMLHAPSLFAPLFRHDTINEPRLQISVTVHNVTAWTHPELLSSREASWVKAMAQRAYKYADAVVVPTHAIAAELSEILDFGERLRVIGGAVSPRLTRQLDALERTARLGLPERFVLATRGPRSTDGIDELIAAMLLPDAAEIPLVLVNSGGDQGIPAMAASPEKDRVIVLGVLSDADLSAVYDRATVFVLPAVADGFGMTMLEAFHFGTPVVHTDVPSLLEVAGDAGLVVARDERDDFVPRLSEAISRIATDDGLASELGILGEDRAKLFSWRSSAEKVWQLHADL